MAHFLWSARISSDTGSKGVRQVVENLGSSEQTFESVCEKSVNCTFSLHGVNLCLQLLINMFRALKCMYP